MNSAATNSSRAQAPGKANDNQSSNTDLRKILEGRHSKELVLAFAGPIGCGTGLVVSEARATLEGIGYEVHVIKLSNIIEAHIAKGTIQVDPTIYAKKSRLVAKTMRLQDGGNLLRTLSTSRLAEFAIEELYLRRREQMKAQDYTGDPRDYVPPRTAYLIDQIKHPDEVLMLRTVYRKLFHLVGVISVAERRRSRLQSDLRADPSELSDLMERDRKQESDNGQQLDKALKLADFFVSTDAGTTLSLQRKLRRFIGLLHGENGITPTSQEYGMYAAYSAGLKSACLSRQVGAAVTDSNGKVVSTGCNDVPKASGGLYTSEDGPHDRRCVHREEQVCFNDREKRSHKSDIRQSLRDLKDSSGNKLIPDEELENALTAVYRASHIDDLTEFSRAVHAEMDALIALARLGTNGIAGGSLYTTTFPCHSCARHIVAAGIRKVYYIEPYEKSLAKKLHDDAITFESEDDDSEGLKRKEDPLHSVKFIHFEGVTPRQYLNFFHMTRRKDGSGDVIKIMPREAPKSVSEYLDNYFDFETKVVERLNAGIRNPAPLAVVPQPD
ncbi:anti-phage dCTP deaminase [Massilia terrae]|uniref:Anti-phage dCTP deaminase n=1 Tax=Massilia terrae TaxID=1811224 RepID=A0ABT2D0L4_9BURK|nr:anti-phage dCTP deaminase [Massilia terrae]MCS0659771.1 anti-phage dCTP deaminase [Massilia terrae]